MKQFLVISTFIEGVNMAEILAHVDAEKQKVKELQQAGQLGEIRMAVPRGKVFIDVFASDDDQAIEIVQQLPMAKFWNLESFELSGKA